MIRYMFLPLILFVVLACQIGCNTASQSPTVESADGSEMREYEVFGMDCPGCHGGVEKLVNKIPGVQYSQANWLQKKLMIKVDPKVELSDEDIRDAIKRANFTPGKRTK